MKAKLATLLALSALTAVLAGPAAAQTTDDVKWINQCVSDNKDEGQTQQVVLSYCTCMNNQMSNNETRSITQWEKTHKREMEMCSSRAGWKGR
jgi:hypothetical protein